LYGGEDVTVLHSGTTKKYSDNWEAVFKSGKTTSKASTGARKKSTARKSSLKKKTSAPKKAAKRTQR